MVLGFGLRPFTSEYDRQRPKKNPKQSGQLIEAARTNL